MNSILKKLSNLFGPGSRDKEEASTPAATAPPAPGTPASSEPPLRRRVIQAPVIMEQDEAIRKSDKVLIKAELSGMRDALKLMVNRPLFDGYSWYFSSFESAAGSRLAEAVFSVDKVETLLVQGSTATVTRTEAAHVEQWKEFAEQLGAAMREAIQSGDPLISDEIKKSIPPEDTVRRNIEKVIDGEVNPGVAAHGGLIVLKKVEGNTVHIVMGGGCQGCSAADLTLKQGIHNAFRNAVPYVGAILDETDHAAGANPYFS
ncbi:NifU family protein [Nitrospina gracilis]|uniref:NifU family protein n=1 Tax=Nitrospina gracilis TaxID=35801 RepID=UPI001F019D5D|nr:Fe-S cluster biogenesis protein NfuA [Nitrospina gracilis Nb-211]